MKAIAIDDEPLALEVIKSLAAKVPYLEMAGYFTNPFEGISFLRQTTVDLVFLDIKMPDISGIDLLKSISDQPMVIFTTAYSEHAVMSFELDAIDYLLKPFSLARFLKACNKACIHYDQLQQIALKNPDVPESIFLKCGTELVRVELSEILYAESSGNYVQFILKQKKIISRLTMAEAEAILPKGLFLRVHRSYIVACNQISKIDRKSVWINNDEIPIGAVYLQSIQSLIK